LISKKLIFNVMSKNVLIVDDSLYMRTVIKDALEAGGYRVIGQASNGEEAIDLAMDLQPDIITLDNILPDMIGTDILKVYKEEGLLSRVIMISAVGQDSVIQLGLNLGAKAYIVKPFTTEQLLIAVQNL
jgi:two-component system, chemotaxis family, chemotaxis protein CheY